MNMFKKMTTATGDGDGDGDDGNRSTDRVTTNRANIVPFLFHLTKISTTKNSYLNFEEARKKAALCELNIHLNIFVVANRTYRKILSARARLLTQQSWHVCFGVCVCVCERVFIRLEEQHKH